MVRASAPQGTTIAASAKDAITAISDIVSAEKEIEVFLRRGATVFADFVSLHVFRNAPTGIALAPGVQATFQSPKMRLSSRQPPQPVRLQSKMLVC